MVLPAADCRTGLLPQDGAYTQSRGRASGTACGRQQPAQAGDQRAAAHSTAQRARLGLPHRRQQGAGVSTCSWRKTLQLTARDSSCRRLVAAAGGQGTASSSHKQTPCHPLVRLLLVCNRAGGVLVCVACRVWSTETSSWRTHCWTAAHARWSRSVILATPRYVGCRRCCLLVCVVHQSAEVL